MIKLGLSVDDDVEETVADGDMPPLDDASGNQDANAASHMEEVD